MVAVWPVSDAHRKKPRPPSLIELLPEFVRIIITVNQGCKSVKHFRAKVFGVRRTNSV